EIGEQILRLDHHVEEGRDRRSLITAHIADAGLQQRLGPRQDAFAPEGVAVPDLDRFDFRLKGAFHERSLAAIFIFGVPLQRIHKKGRSKAARSWLVLVPPQIYAKSARKDATN